MKGKPKLGFKIIKGKIYPKLTFKEGWFKRLIQWFKK